MTSRHSGVGDPPGRAPGAAVKAASPVVHLPGPVEARLVDLRSAADALATQLGMSSVAAGRLLSARADEVRRALVALRAALAAAGLLSPGGPEESIAQLSDLLARCAPLHQRPRLARHARKLLEAASDVHGDVVAAAAQAQRRLDRPVLQALRRFDRAHGELQLQCTAGAAVDRLTGGLRGAALDQRRRRLEEEVAELSRRLEERHARLAAQREMSAVLWRELDAELLESVEEVGSELARLLA
ncbi:hypothetical protein K2Z84_21195 [Candidatus Binatia bacterium]|nr:hypothetical protein [Candidatus Binatia bacterium]